MNYKYIHFNPVPTKNKTGVWQCCNNKSGMELGIVKWYPAWRQYCYFPSAYTIYNKGCLEDINTFIESEMNKRKTKGSSQNGIHHRIN